MSAPRLPQQPITVGLDVIQRLYPPDRFVGREWLIAEAERFLLDPDRHRLVILGEPGSGKSAFLAYLASTWNAPRHFIRTDNKIGVAGASARSCLVSLGFQLFQLFGADIFPAPASQLTSVKVKWASGKAEVVGRVIDTLVTLGFGPQANRQVRVQVGVAKNQSSVIGERIGQVVEVAQALEPAELLHVMLVNPLLELYRQDPTICVPILIDALDESQDHPRPWVLDVLPVPSDAAYPPNLKLLMTSRDTAPATFGKGEILRLDDTGRGYAQLNSQDARTYLATRLAQPDLAAATSLLSQAEQQRLADELHRRSEGNFLYLFYVLNAIAEAAATDPEAVRSIPIPENLDEVYRVFAMSKIKRPGISLSEWTNTFEPVIGLLAVAREALDAKALAVLSGIDEGPVNFIVGAIHQFLDVADSRYRIYHRDFAEYLLDPGRNPDFPLRPERFHEKIARAFVPRAGSRKPALSFDVAGGYAVRHLMAHLVAAGRAEDLHRLLALTDRQGGNQWFAAKTAADDLGGFTVDVAAAWEMLRNRSNSTDPRNLRIEARYSFAMSSVRSLSALVPPPMVAALLTSNTWSAAVALSYAALGDDATDRALTAVALLEAGPEWAWDEARRIAMHAIAAISVRGERERVIGSYAAALRRLPAESPLCSSDSILEDLQEIAGPRATDREASSIFVEFGPLLSAGAADWAYQRADGFTDALWFAYALSAIAASGTAGGERDLRRALTIAASEAGRLDRANLGRAWAMDSFLRAGGDPGLIADDAKITLQAADEEDEAWVDVYALLAHLSAPEDLPRRLRRLLDADGAYISQVDELLTRLCQRVPGPIAALLMQDSLAVEPEDTLTSFRWMHVALRVARWLPADLRLALARRAIALLTPSHLGGLLGRQIGNLGPLPPDLFDDAIKVANAVSGQERRAYAVAGLTACAPPERREAVTVAALDLVTGLKSSAASSVAFAEVLGNLAPALSGEGLQAALRVAGLIQDRQAATGNLSAIMTYLTPARRKQVVRRVIEVVPSYLISEGDGPGSWHVARTFRALAPQIPAAFAEEAAGIARQLPKPTARALALAVLAPAFTRADRPTVLTEARRSLPDDAAPADRAEALAAMAAAASGDQRKEFASSAVAEIDRTTSWRDKVHTIQAVQPLLTEEQLIAGAQRCMAQASRREDAENVIAMLAEWLPVSFIERELHLGTSKPEFPKEMVPVLIRLATAGHESRARELAAQWKIDYEALPVMAADEAEKLLLSDRTDYLKASIGIRLAQLGHLKRAWEILDQLSDPDDALRLCTRLAIIAARNPQQEDLLALWRRCLDLIATRKRASVMGVIYELAPVAAAIVGHDGPNILFDEINQTLGWWP
jgi:hypothetical protein